MVERSMGGEEQESRKLFYGVVWFSLLGTLLLGGFLRWALAGVPLPSWFTFRFLKHAHSHLAYFGLLFPLVWACWWQKEGFFLPRRWGLFYLVGVLLSTVGFLRAGYAIDSIIGSTIVLVVWLFVAWKQRKASMVRGDWFSFAPLGTLLGALCIPPIAILSRRDPALGALWVKTFLSLLIFLVALPAVLSRLSFPAPARLFWIAAALAGALFLGVVPSPWLGLGLVGMAGWILWGAWRERGLPWDLRVFWWAWGTAMGAVGMGVVAYDHFVGIAGLHFTLLGPFLMSCWWIFVQKMPSFWLRYPYAVFLLGMCLCIAGQSWWSAQMTLLWGSAIFGSLLILWLCLLFWGWIRTKQV